MQRTILIIDDYDDLGSSLSEVFTAAGHRVEFVDSREEAIEEKDLNAYDIVITDLAGDEARAEPGTSMPGSNGNGTCLPCGVESPVGEYVKAFKFCAAHFPREDFNEDELKNFVETVLNFKSRYLDTEAVVKRLHEKIEFELPSAIAPMHSILDYLIQRVEKFGGRPHESNLFVALDEAFVNAVKHGNKYNAQKVVRISA